MMFKTYLRIFECLCFVIIANAHNINTEPYAKNSGNTTTVISEGKERKFFFNVNKYTILIFLEATATCPPYRFRCDNGECIQLNLKCDAIKDCSDGSDEINCTPPSKACADKQFECHNKLCIPHGWTCDGDSDCEDGSDEDPIKCKNSN